MTKKINILVSGCGGDIGQSIGKILTSYPDRYRVFGTDISDRNPAKFIFPAFQLGLPVTDPQFPDRLRALIREYRIDLYIPIAEPELRFFDAQGFSGEIEHARMITANARALHTGFDKLRTAAFLKEAGLPHPETWPAAGYRGQLPWPFILKARTGSGGKNRWLIRDLNDQDYLFSKIDPEAYIVQEYLEAGDDEYTCGLFRGSDGLVRSISFRRELTGGYSGYGELAENPQIDALLRQVAEKLDLRGSINVQLRLRDGQPVVFEINPRFSSTVLYRHLFGFRDLLWSVSDALGEPVENYVPDPRLKYFYKGFSEYVS